MKHEVPTHVSPSLHKSDLITWQSGQSQCEKHIRFVRSVDKPETPEQLEVFWSEQSEPPLRSKVTMLLVHQQTI